MSDGPLVELDLDGFRKTVAVVRAFKADVVRSALGDPASRFVAQCQVYITRQIDKSLKEHGDIPEGTVKTVRGVTWKGWAEWQVKRTRAGYGGTVTEGTRYRQRKFARGSVAVKAGRTWTADARKAMMAMPTAQRPYEKVWKKRASKQRYSASSKMMQDTGRMRAGIFLMDVHVESNVIELRPSSSQVVYFRRQNDMRPMWFLEIPKDENQVAIYAQEALDDLARLIQEPR